MSEIRARMRIGGMTCDDCNLHVKRALERAGAREVRADFRRGEALFVVDTSSFDALSDAVRRAGYQPGGAELLEGEERPERASLRDGADSDYDLAIIGSGSAAFAAAIRARDLGARVVMTEQGPLGGTCVNVGCVPSKTMLRAAEVYWQRTHQPFPSMGPTDSTVDLAALVRHKGALVDALRKEKYEALVDLYGWEVLHGHARFADTATVLVDGRALRASAYLIATGASPSVPPIPGLAEAGYLTSTTALELEEVPRTLAVIGANAVGLEMAQLFQRLGAQVTLYEGLARIAPFDEPEIGETLREILETDGMKILPSAHITSVTGSPGTSKTVRCVAEGREANCEAEAVLVATGRRPNTANLGLEQAGVEVDGRGAVVVDEQLRTTNPLVWAAGDVTPAPQFVYVSAYEGTLAAENILTGGGRAVDLRVVPRVTFTSPQIAAVGLTEAQAREGGYQVRTATLPASALPRALVNGETDGLFKLVMDEATGHLLGAHILAENAGDVIYAATLAVQFGLTVQDLLGTFAPYLTMAEGLKLAAQTFHRDVSKLSCCAA